jgi:hypothetical protein
MIIPMGSLAQIAQSCSTKSNDLQHQMGSPEQQSASLVLADSKKKYTQIAPNR